MAVKFLIHSNKGGVGKTELSHNIAHSLASKGKKVLLVDLDSQANLTELNLGMDSLKKLNKSLVDALINYKGSRRLPIQDVIIKLDENLDLVPCNIELAAVDSILNNELGRDYLIKNVISPVEENYDIIIFDSAPTANLMCICAMAYVDYLIIPFDASYFSYRGVQIVVEHTMPRVQFGLNQGLELYGLICNMYQANIIHDREIRTEAINDGFNILETINRSVKVKDAFYAGKALVLEDPKHPISVGVNNITDKIIDDINSGRLYAKNK